MRRLSLTTVTAVSLLSLTACTEEGASDTESASALLSDNATVCVLNTLLRPENEVRTAANTTDPTVESTASGHAQIKVREDGTIEYKVFILNPAAETFTAGHIHIGAAGVNGPVVRGLFAGPAFTDARFMQSESFSAPTLAEALCANPSDYYVNYHTPQDPVGAIRGQL